MELDLWSLGLCVTPVWYAIVAWLYSCLFLPALLVCFGMLACWCSLAYCSLGSGLLQLVNLLLEGPLGLALAVVVSWSRLRVALLPSQFVNEFCWCKVCSLS
jgi:hypothetical protein